MRYILTIAIVLFGCSIGIGQDQKHHEPRYLLEDPDVIKLEVLPTKPEYSEHLFDKRYKEGSKIYFRILATNLSIETLSIVIWTDRLQDRPQLTGSGKPVPYKASLDGLLETQTQDELFLRTMPQVLKLKPSEQREIGYLFLDRWFEPLIPGIYQISVRHRFEPGQKWIGSSAITFEVLPKN
jgi:hypothetical protein